MALESVFSGKWTAVERLAVAFMLADMIRNDIINGTYSHPGHPNVQSIHEFSVSDPKVCETYRNELDTMVEAWSRDRFTDLLLRLDDVTSQS